MIGRLSALLPTLIVLSVATTSLSGCAPKTHWQWEHTEQMDEGQLSRDIEQCRALAHTESVEYSVFFNDNPFFWRPRPRRFHADPLWDWPYRDHFMYRREHEKRLFHFCMKSKGWSLSIIRNDATQESNSAEKSR